MMKGVSQSLVVRVTIINMTSLSANEIQDSEEVPFQVNIEK